MSSSIQKLTIELDGIGHALSDNKLKVPIYQRSYAWEDKHVKDLYDDLISAIRNSEDEYFIGSIVVSLGAGLNEVVDGQQRLATISILIAAIRDYFIEKEENERAEHLQNTYLSSQDRRTLEIIPNLTLNNNDHDFFYNYIIVPPNKGRKEISPTRDSHERIKNAYKIAKNDIGNFIISSNRPIDYLLDLCDFIDLHLKVILVKVPDHANAFTIFETLNDRGLELAISDLLKNYLLGQADNRIQEVQECWTRMYSLLENTENEGLVVTFIRQYWSSIHGLTRERELYDKIKNKITSKQRSIDLAIELEKNARIYVALVDTNNTFWNDYSDEAKIHMSLLNMFGMTQVRPLLLSIMGKFSLKEIEKALKFLVSASVRFLIHGGLGGGALETQYSERAKEISEGTINTTNDLIGRLVRVVPSDAQFRESFKTASVSKLYLARYYLSVLERASNGDDKPELVPNTDTTAVNLEHILPKNPDSSWGIDTDTHKALVNRIGNLAILSAKLNSSIGNGAFLTKKEFYRASKFTLTIELSNYLKWGTDEINQRQEKLAEIAVKSWSIK